MNLHTRLAGLEKQYEELNNEVNELETRLEQAAELKKEREEEHEVWRNLIKEASTLKIKFYKYGSPELVEEKRDMFEEIAKHEALVPLLVEARMVQFRTHQCALGTANAD